MRSAIAMIFLGFLLSSPARADHISVYQPSGGPLTGDCNLELGSDPTYALNIVHTSDGGATGSEFGLAFDWGSGSGTILSGSSPYAPPPYNWNGVSFQYGSCRTGEIFVAQIIVAGQTNTECEAFLYVRPPAGATDATAVDCDGFDVPATTGRLSINGNSTCPCEAPVPVEMRTWGKIKAMYGVNYRGR